eukprot:TRINITY_DN6216_c0_g1_i2.p1 TRINITY_DN6216_c0_g1~~TRINITY_DN6216_c0_g1_i2.p1  ORF type:complete len:2958 (-),score=456.23 TRINITY_DN6216_c0_g1_i2:383-9256(-)
MWMFRKKFVYFSRVPEGPPSPPRRGPPTPIHSPTGRMSFSLTSADMDEAHPSIVGLLTRDLLDFSDFTAILNTAQEIFPRFETMESLPACNILVLRLFCYKILNFTIDHVSHIISSKELSACGPEAEPLIVLRLIASLLASPDNRQKLFDTEEHLTESRLLGSISRLLLVLSGWIHTNHLAIMEALASRTASDQSHLSLPSFLVETIDLTLAILSHMVELDAFAQQYWSMIKDSLKITLSDLQLSFFSWEKQGWPSKLRIQKALSSAISSTLCDLVYLQSCTSFLQPRVHTQAIWRLFQLFNIALSMEYEALSRIILKYEIVSNIGAILRSFAAELFSGAKEISKDELLRAYDVIILLHHTLFEVANRYQKSSLELDDPILRQSLRHALLCIHSETVQRRLAQSPRAHETTLYMPSYIDADAEVRLVEFRHRNDFQTLDVIVGDEIIRQSPVLSLISVYFHHIRYCWSVTFHRNVKAAADNISASPVLHPEVEVWTFLLDLLFDLTNGNPSSDEIKHVLDLRLYPDVQTCICIYLCSLLIKSESLGILQKLNDYNIWRKLTTSSYFYSCFMISKDYINAFSLDTLKQQKEISISTRDFTNASLLSHKLLRKALEAAFVLACHNTVDYDFEDDIAWKIIMDLASTHTGCTHIVSEMSIWSKKALSYVPDSPLQSERKSQALNVFVSLVLEYQRSQYQTQSDLWVRYTQNCLVIVVSHIIEVYDDSRSLALSNDAIFQCLVDSFSNPTTQTVARNCLVYVLMNETNESRAPKISALRKICELFSRAPISSQDPITLYSVVFDLVCLFVRTNEPDYQKYFREAGIFLHIVNIMNGPYADAVCCEVLRTLKVLLRGNQESKDFFRSYIGYNHLSKLILSVQNVPMQSVVRVILETILEEDLSALESTGQPMIRNLDALPLLTDIAVQYSDPDIKEFVLDKVHAISEVRQYNVGQLYASRIMDDLLLLLAQMPLSYKAYDPLVRLCSSIGSYAVTVKQARILFHLLKITETNQRAAWNDRILQILRHIVDNTGPRLYFDFYGADSSLNLPSVGGLEEMTSYSFVTFVRIENFHKKQIKRPTILSLLDENGYGLELYFDGPNLCVAACNPKKTYKYVFQHQFLPRKWNFIAITHSTSKIPFSNDEVKLYINDDPPIRGSCRFPHLKNPLTKSCIGSRSRDLPSDVPQKYEWVYGLVGQLGPVYFFNEMLSANDIKVIRLLGYDYAGSFLPYEANSMPRTLRYAFDGALSSKLVFQYVCKATNGRTFYDLASEDPSNPMIITRHAIPNYLCAKVDPPFSETLVCLGGIQVILPLLASAMFPIASQQDDPPHIDEKAYLNTAMGLLSKLLEKKYAQDDIFACGGFLAMGYLLRYVDPSYHSTSLISNLYSIFLRLFDADLKQQYLEHVILNMRIWIFTDAKLQTDIWKFIKKIIGRCKEFLQETFGTQAFVDILQLFYWYTPEALCFAKMPRIHPITQAVVGRRPELESITDIRKQILKCITNLIQNNPNPNCLQPMINYIASCKDWRQIVDVLDHIVAQKYIWSSENIAKYFPMDAIDMILTILNHPEEKVRLGVLRVFGCLLLNFPENKVIEDRIPFIQAALQPFPVSMSVYRMLLHILAPKEGLDPIDYVIDDDSHIKYMCMLPLILDLLPHMDEELQARLCQDFSLLFKLSTNNRVAAIENPMWVYYFCRYFCESSQDLGDSISDRFVHTGTAYKLIRQLLSILIVGAIFNQRDGVEFVEIFLIYMSYHSTQNNLSHLRYVAQLVLQDSVKMMSDQLSEEKTNLGYFFQLQRGDKHEVNIANFIELLELFVYNASSSVDPADRALSLLTHPISSCVDHSATSIWSKFSILVASEYASKLDLIRTDAEWQEYPLVVQVLTFISQSVLSINSSKISDSESRHRIYTSALRLSIVALYQAASHSKLLPDFDIFIKTIQIIIHRQNCLNDLMTEANTAVVLIGLISSFKRLTPDISVLFHQQVFPLIKHLMDSLPLVARTLVDPERANARLSNLWLGSKKQVTSDVMDCLSRLESRWDSTVQKFVRTLKKECSSHRVTASIARIRHYSESKDNRIPITVSRLEQHLDRQKELENFIRSRVLYLKKTIRDTEDKRLASVYNDYIERNSRAINVWRNIFRNLNSDRGPWSQRKSDREYWVLDPTEDRSRCRRRLKRLYQYDPHENCAQNRSEPVAEPLSEPSNTLIKPISVSIIMLDPVEESDASELQEKEKEMSPDIQDRGTAKTLAYQTIALLVTPMDTVEGSLEVSSSGILFVPLNMDTTKDLPFIFSVDEVDKRDRVLRWDLQTITEIHARRYLLQANSLELFFTDKSTLFLCFPNRDRSKVYRIIKNLKPASLVDADLTHGSARLAKSNLTERWMRREISNFDYLLALNTIAGRTYNDLMQYPVFPWILNDYTSKELDLRDSRIYRDLSKPIGALNETRLAQFVDRYESYDDPDIPKFHYGSHYSSAGIVLHYLIRLEPFTTWFLQLQGGKFDHADRLFYSIPNTWKNVLSSSADVKELIPEFFYLPEFLVNLNGVEFGRRQTGHPIEDVELPPWASSSDEFVRIHREALESDYVSENLHNWIDLIFGYKQKGPEAIKAHNVFYYLTYEGSIDLGSISDPVLRRSYESQIANFGQTPTQILKHPHPRRSAGPSIQRPLLFDSSSAQSLQTSPNPLSSESFSSRPIVSLFAVQTTKDISLFLSTEKMYRLFVVDADRRLYLERLVPRSETSQLTFPAESNNSVPREVGISDSMEQDHISRCCITLDGHYLLTAGHWDYSFKIHDPETGDIRASVSSHRGRVTCIAAGEGYIATGSQDCTIHVWQMDLPVYDYSSLTIPERPTHILYGHDDEITGIAINTALDLIVSTSKDGSIIVHRLYHGDYIRSIFHPKRQCFSSLLVTSEGYIVSFSMDDLTIRTYSMNGSLLADCEVMIRVRAMCVSPDGNYLIVGADNGILSIRKVYK